MQSWIPFLPESASTMSGRVDALYFYLIGVTFFFTTLIVLVITYFAVRYRRRSPNEIPRPIEGSLPLETLWTVIPFLIAMSMFVWGASVFFGQYRMPREAMEISVVGKQWMWKFEHPTGQREIDELHVPLGTKVKLIMTTEDVIHSFFVPAFRIKQDVVPGRYTMLWFDATKAGTYHLFCAEYCGTNHSGMTGSIVVMEPADFNNWLSGNAGRTSPGAAGQNLYANMLGCASCHGDKGQGGRGPALTGILGKPVQLDNGATVVADESYLRESILNPQAKIVAGYGPIMPTFAGQLNEEQLLQLITYIKSLSPQQPAPAAGAATQPQSTGTSDAGARPANSQAANPSNSNQPASKPGAGEGNKQNNRRP